MDHGDPTPKRSPRRPTVDTLTEYLNVSSVGAVVAANDLSERRLASAVLANERVNLSVSKIEIDAIENDR
jgi:hypothetical protein